MVRRNSIRFVVAALTGALVLPSAAQVFPTAEQRGGNLADPQQAIAQERRSVIVEAVQRVSPSVASVMVTGYQRVPIFNDPFYQSWFGFGPTTSRRVVMQSGSAVMISAEGEFLTNHHVVQGAESVALLLPNGDTRPARVIGQSAKLDIALLQCDPEGMEPAPLGSAEELIVGEWLVAIGFPVGGRGIAQESRFRPTVTVGVVSALQRSFTPSSRRRGRAELYYPDMIQTDAAINPGNSGGPIANALGEIVGINTFILSDSGGSQGLGFAIPIERALQAADELRTHGRVREVDFSGLRFYSEITPAIAAEIGLEHDYGLMVAEPGVTAAAGLRKSDVILDIDRKPMHDTDDARLALVPRFVGDRVALGVWREGRRIELEMVLSEARR